MKQIVVVGLLVHVLLALSGTAAAITTRTTRWRHDELLTLTTTRKQPVSHHFDLQSACRTKRPLSLLSLAAKTNKSDKSSPSSNNNNLLDLLRTFQEKPGTLLIAPFVVLVALDLVANIAVITKRSIEYALTGQYTEWHF